MGFEGAAEPKRVAGNHNCADAKDVSREKTATWNRTMEQNNPIDQQ